MSYILDALRKSDQQRRRGAAPTLPPLQAEAAAAKRPVLLAYGVLGLVLLGAGIAIGWLRPWQPQPPAPAAVIAAAATAQPQAQAENAAPAISAVVATAPAPTPVPAAAAPAPNAAQAPSSSTIPAQLPAIAPVRALAPEQQAAGLGRDSRSAPAAAAASGKTAVPERAAGPAGATAAAVSAVMAMSDLPLAIQQELPPMSISVHAYSARAAERLVGINNRLLHEGDEVAPGLRLEQITPGGMILSYKGYSFRRGVH